MRGRAFASASALVLATIVASGARGDEVDELLARARDARDRGQLEYALDLLRAAHDAAPLPEILNNIGVTLEKLGNYREADAAYRAVAANPAAPQALVQLDLRRIQELTPKVHRAWLAFEIEPVPRRIWIAGVELAPPFAEEQALGASTSTPVFIEGADGAALALLIVATEVGRRTVARMSFQRTEEYGRLELSGIEPPLLRLAIDGNALPVRGAASAREVWLAPGRHSVESELTGRAPVAVVVFLAAGERVSLAEKLRPPEAVLPGVTIEAPPAPSVLPWVVVGAGVASAATGAVFYGLAMADRSRLRNAGEHEDPIVSITQPEAFDLVDRSSRRADIGVPLLAVGGAVIIGGVAWWLIER